MSEDDKRETRLTIPPRTDFFRRMVPELEQQWEVSQANSWKAHCLLMKAMDKADRDWLGEPKQGEKPHRLRVSEYNALVNGVKTLAEIEVKMGEAVLAHGGVKPEKVIEAYEATSKSVSEVIASLKARAAGRKV